jgi:hypothetical protein
MRISKKNRQWPKEKVQKDKQQATKYTHKTKDRVTRFKITILYYKSVNFHIEWMSFGCCFIKSFD